MRLPEPQGHRGRVRTILTEAFGLYRSNLRVLVGINALVHLPVIALALHSLNSDETARTWPIPYVALLVGAGFVTTAAVTRAVSVALAGSRPGVVDSYRPVVRAALPFAGTFLLWAGALSAIAVAAVALWLSSLAVLIYSASGPATGILSSRLLAWVLFAAAVAVSIFLLVLYVWMMLAPSLVVADNRRYLDALSASRRLVKGHWWQALLTVALAVLIVVLLQTCVMLPVRAALGVTHPAGSGLGPPGPAVLAVTGIGMLVTMALWPFVTTATVLLYFDLTRKRAGTIPQAE